METTTKSETAYEKHRLTARIGDGIEIPTQAVGVTISEIDPFSDSVLVSWLQKVSDLGVGLKNTTRIRETRTSYTDTAPVSLPHYAWAVTVYEPASTDDTVVYWLE